MTVLMRGGSCANRAAKRGMINIVMMPLALLPLLPLLTGCSKDPVARDARDVESAESRVQTIEIETLDGVEPRSLVTAMLDDDWLLNTEIHHSASAYIPSQCYTRTRDAEGRVHNPCFTCHAEPKAPNYIDDASFQTAYEFRDTSRQNPWINLFRDRTQAVSAQSDEAIMAYVRQSNYLDQDGHLILAETLKSLPKHWDFNGDGQWNGYTPDCYFNFDNEGFDRAPDGTDTGWRAFGYAPFLGTFWPTNGSTDDVIIRLAAPFRKNETGQWDRAVYRLNLAIVEAMIQRKNVAIPSTDETRYQVDLDKDGTLGVAQQVVFDWAPLEGRMMSYVGEAKQALAQGKVHLAAGLYPEGTEFIHSVRYLDYDATGAIRMSARFKELRYGIKTQWNTYAQLKNVALEEVKEAHDFPDRLRQVVGNPEAGMVSGVGWSYQGFIEDRNGDLRPQSYEESLNCIGCHAGISQTTDGSFAFPRKFGAEAFQGGWYHWTQKGLSGTPEPKWSDGTYEYTQYLLENRSGNEFRDNAEVMERFFDKNGDIKPRAVQRLHEDIGFLLLPSIERAKLLNKAYKVIVDEQSYIYGRTPHIQSLKDTVWLAPPEDEPTGVKTPVLIP